MRVFINTLYKVEADYIGPKRECTNLPISWMDQGQIDKLLLAVPDDASAIPEAVECYEIVITQPEGRTCVRSFSDPEPFM